MVNSVTGIEQLIIYRVSRSPLFLYGMIMEEKMLEFKKAAAEDLVLCQDLVQNKMRGSAS